MTELTHYQKYKETIKKSTLNYNKILKLNHPKKYAELVEKRRGYTRKYMSSEKGKAKSIVWKKNFRERKKLKAKEEVKLCQ